MSTSEASSIQRALVTVVLIAVSAAVGIAVFLLVAFLPVALGQEGYMLVWGYIGFPLGIVLGPIAFVASFRLLQRRAVKGRVR
jgi:hypothetical protein